MSRIKIDQCMGCNEKPLYEVLLDGNLHRWYCEVCFNDIAENKIREILSVKQIKGKASYHFAENKSLDLWENYSKILEQLEEGTRQALHTK